PHLITQVVDGGVHTVEPVINGVGQGVGAVTDAVLDGVDAALKVIQCKALVDVGAGGPALAGRGAQAIAAAKIAVAAPTEHPEDQKEDDPGRPIAAPHGAAAIAIAALI